MTAQQVAADPANAEVYAADDLRTYASRVFHRLGMRTADADVLAEHLVWADLHGVPSLGLRKMPQYVPRLRAGGTPPGAQTSVVHQQGVITHLDGNDGWGQVVGAHGMRLAVDNARAFGVGLTLVRNTTSAGAIGRLASFAVDEDMIGLVINNGPPIQAVWGSAEKTIGNQAFAIASPAGKHPPLVLDMATSSITLARLHEYVASGESIQPGLALDADGEPTVDPVAALKGLLLPFGGHRGSGLAMMWEVLTGVLAVGERFLSDVTMPDVSDRPQAVSLFMLAINPSMLMPSHEFRERVDRVIDHVHGAEKAPGFDAVQVPGERSHATAEQRQRDGITLPPKLIGELHRLGDELGVAWPTGRR
ncbi:MAG TPA: Ldh family oxidoreductase [Jatrophihabitans sp.]|nr:Ldh family oxidoreductase [Jatrophihabitans sp.]